MKVKNYKPVFLILFLILAFSISISTVDDVNAASNTLYVNGTSGDDNYDGTSPVPVDDHIGPKKNIQTALDSVADDGLIHVSEGKYMESLTINRNVELRGGGHSVTELNPVNPEDNIIVINSAVTKAVISGFTISGSNNAGIVNEGTGVTIENNSIIDNGKGITALKNSETVITGNSIKGNGIGIFSYSENTILNFNRIYRNDVAIETTNVMDAAYNWWGSNTAPDIENVKNSRWIYMTFNVDPSIILAGGTSQLTANFNNEYDGTTLGQFDPVSMGHIPDGLLVRFTTNLGNVGSKTIDIETNNGIATATLTADEGTGTATVSAKMDHEEQINCVGIEYLYVNVGTGDDLWSGTSPVFISGNTGPLKTIQTAINKINSGGTIQIAPGTYKESLEISKSLTLNGSGQDQTIIDGEQIRRIINISGTPTVNINNLTLKNGSSSHGGAIYNYGGTVLVTDVSFVGNTATNGGAILNYGILSVVDGSFVGNTATYGGAILNYGSAATVLGTYFYNNIGNNAGGAILNYGSLSVVDGSFVGNTATNGGAISNYGGLSVVDGSFVGNTATNGGAICNYDILSVVDGSFVGNTASSVGGAILNYGSAATVLGTYFYNNIGNNAGGAIYNYGILSVVDGSFVGNIADCGGAILNYDSLSVSGSSFTDNTATYYGGGAIFNYGTVTANFNRIVDNSITVIENIGGTVDARYNWWGSNNNPISKVVDTVVTPWLVLTGTANPTIIPKNSLSTINLNLLYDSGILTDPNNPNLYYHDPNDGHIPDGTLATFSTTLGNIIASSNFINGVAQATLNGGIINGIADVSGTVDSETLHLLVTVDTIAPTAWANLKTGLYNVNKLVSLKMSEGGTIYYTKNGANPSIYSAKYVGAILITATTTLKFFALDKAGNPSPIYTYKYTIDKIAPKVTYTYPKNLRTGQSRTATLYLKFSEKIKTSLYWSKIYVKNLKTGKKVSIRKWIKGNILYIKTRYKRPALRWFRVYVPYKAVKDYAGNNLARTYTYKFKTRR
ncbi:MAG: chitobiase/beta-hexosaminidase C-terminal domain-containing protein [Methanobacteriaceae archaeon]|nr:chitobiase/beta-hexosaminidase C-terminal domain-containing protein [Methanobacteriaceae archaeon]